MEEKLICIKRVKDTCAGQWKKRGVSKKCLVLVMFLDLSVAFRNFKCPHALGCGARVTERECHGWCQNLQNAEFGMGEEFEWDKASGLVSWRGCSVTYGRCANLSWAFEEWRQAEHGLGF